MCCVTSSDDRAIACSGDSVPASAAFMCVPRMVSTADHSVVRGRQNGGAGSDAAIAWKNGYRLFNATSVRIERWTLALVTQEMKRYAQSFCPAALGMPSSQLPIIGICRPDGPIGSITYPTLPMTVLTWGFSRMSDASAGQTLPSSACPVATKRVRSAASVVSGPGCATALSCPTKNLSALAVAPDLNTTFH